MSTLESRYEQIKAEFLGPYQASGLGTHPESAELAAAGSWRTFYFFNMGERYDANLDACPDTAGALAHVPGIEAAGMAYFSVMAPGTVVNPHSGFVNTRIAATWAWSCRRTAGCGSARSAAPGPRGRCLVFDDSFEHEVRIGDRDHRAVLLLDTWHPDLTRGRTAGDDPPDGAVEVRHRPRWLRCVA